jgi:hypothetical protein
MAGWSDYAELAVHLTDEGLCDKVVQKSQDELDLSWAMRRIGNLIGKPEDIITHVGQPNSRGGGASYTRLQWIRPGYRIALKFDVHKQCLGITHQHVGRPVAR